MTRLALLLMGAVALLAFAVVVLVVLPITHLERVAPSSKLKPVTVQGSRKSSRLLHKYF